MPRSTPENKPNHNWIKHMMTSSDKIWTALGTKWNTAQEIYTKQNRYRYRKKCRWRGEFCALLKKSVVFSVADVFRTDETSQYSLPQSLRRTQHWKNREDKWAATHRTITNEKHFTSKCRIKLGKTTKKLYKYKINNYLNIQNYCALCRTNDI